MARREGAAVENNFTAGLITETTALRFPANAATETFNCIFDEIGVVTRRGPIDLESDYSVFSSPSTVGDYYNEYLWTAVSGIGQTSFLVQQQGKYLHFYDVSTDTTASILKLPDVIDISTFLATDNVNVPGENRCAFAQGNGDLFVTNPATDPFYVSYEPTTNTLTATRITIEFRDFVGFTTESDPTFTPVLAAFGADRPVAGDFYLADGSAPAAAAGVAEMKVDGSGRGKKHYYNLLNQGWWQGRVDSGTPTTGALGAWDTARTDLPGDNDYVGFYRESAVSSFINTRVTNFGQGNTPAPKGHFILRLGDIDRQEALVNDGFTLDVTNSSTSVSEISRGIGSIIGNYTDESKVFDGNTNQGYLGPVAATGAYRWNSAPTFNTGYCGKNYSGAGTAPFAIDKAICYPGNQAGYKYFSSDYDASGGGPGVPTNVGISGTAYLYASNSAPSSGTDGTLLGQAGYAGGGNAVITTINSNNTTSEWNYVWVYFDATSRGNSQSLAEIKFYESITTTSSSGGGFIEAEATPERPTECAFYAGRAWFGGMDANLVSNNLYFSQIVENESQYGRCYQRNDPTSEFNPDLLPNDGGIVRIPEMGKIKRFFIYQNTMLVFATNGVWTIRGSSAIGFTATDYVVRKISSLGTQSSNSFVDVKGFPVWWGEEGILAVEYNPQFDSFSVKSLTDDKIRDFFLSIPASNRADVKGAYDVSNEVAYWIYDSSTVQGNNSTSLNSVLCYNTRSEAFYPWTFGDGTPDIKGVIFIQDSIGFSTPKMAYTTIFPVDSSNTYITYSDTLGTDYTDWATYATAYSDAASALDYTSYFITGYKPDADAQRYFQSNYVFVFLNQETNASCYVQSIFDFTSSGNSGKWSVKQQAYNDGLTNTYVNYRRLKLRGKGRCLQMKFTSESGKPFSIIGWSIWSTANAQV